MMVGPDFPNFSTMNASEPDAPLPPAADDWTPRFASRMRAVKTSFIREILKVTENPEVISFAGGLPSPELFPTEALAEIAADVLRTNGREALQYSTTEGYRPLREWVCGRYAERFGLAVDPDEILITTGSQQGLDLLAKVFIDAGDTVAIERPGYLGAIQAFSVYQPVFAGVTLTDTGLDVPALRETLAARQVKLLYTVPNFQNPSGRTYAAEVRRAVAEAVRTAGTVLVEDDPYGELRYRGADLPPLRTYNPDGIMLGSFSKLVAPGLRLGWVCAPREVIRRLVVMKQAADLHTDIFAQRIMHRYLAGNVLGAHLARLRAVYGRRAATMVAALRRELPPGAGCNDPDGGMFLWATLPVGVEARVLFERAAERKVAFVPGTAFYVGEGGERAMRLNFTNTDEARIEEGVRRLAEAVKALG
jgi:2-aminoadipate transaminase